MPIIEGEEDHPVPINGKAVIRQSHSKVHMRVDTEESHGDLLAGEILRKEDDTYQFVAVFRNEPNVRFRHRSSIHMGALRLDVIGPPNSPTELRGSYWNDRRRVGEFIARRAPADGDE